VVKWHVERRVFPTVGSEKGAKETWAKPEIWKDIAKFQAGFPKAIDLAKAVAATKDEAAFKTACTRSKVVGARDGLAGRA
jgi:cytochrome c556